MVKKIDKRIDKKINKVKKKIFSDSEKPKTIATKLFGKQ